MPENEITQEECDETHEGFEIKCVKCESTMVYFENDMGYSPESGGWGSADLVCHHCGNRTSLVEA